MTETSMIVQHCQGRTSKARDGKLARFYDHTSMRYLCADCAEESKRNGADLEPIEPTKTVVKEVA